MKHKIHRLYKIATKQRNSTEDQYILIAFMAEPHIKKQ